MTVDVVAPPAAVRRVSWAFLAQALNTATNFVLSIFVARSVTTHDFGVFALIYAIYTVMLGASRATGNNVLAVISGDRTTRLHEAAATATGYAVALGASAGGICVVVSTLVGEESARYALLALAVGFPFLLMQDAVRGYFFACGRPRAVAANDAIWAGVQLIALAAILSRRGHPPMWQFIAVWALGGACASAVGLAYAAIIPRVGAARTWLLDHRALAAPMLASFCLGIFPTQLTYLLMPTVSDVSEVGVVRAAYLLFGPLGVLFAGTFALLLPDASRAEDEAAILRITARTSAALAAIAVLWGVAMIALPPPVGRALLGPTWDSTLGPRILLAGSLVAEGVLLGAQAALNALHDAARLVRVQLVTSPLTIVCALSLAAVWGAEGTAAGFLVGFWVSALMAWRTLLRRRAA